MSFLASWFNSVQPFTVFYKVIGVANLSSGAWSPVPGAGPRLGTGGPDALSDTNQPPRGPFYKLQVELP